MPAPIGQVPDVAGVNLDDTAGRNFLDAGKGRGRRGKQAEAEVSLQSGVVERHRQLELGNHAGDLRGKNYRLGGLREKQRPFARTVAHQGEPAFARIPDGDGKSANQFFGERCAEFQIHSGNHGHVGGLRHRPSTVGQPAAQFLVIIYFPVADRNHAAGRVHHRLMTVVTAAICCASCRTDLTLKTTSMAPKFRVNSSGVKIKRLRAMKLPGREPVKRFLDEAVIWKIRMLQRKPDEPRQRHTQEHQQI